MHRWFNPLVITLEKPSRKQTFYAEDPREASLLGREPNPSRSVAAAALKIEGSVTVRLSVILHPTPAWGDSMGLRDPGSGREGGSI